MPKYVSGPGPKAVKPGRVIFSEDFNRYKDKNLKSWKYLLKENGTPFIDWQGRNKYYVLQSNSKVFYGYSTASKHFKAQTGKVAVEFKMKNWDLKNGCGVRLMGKGIEALRIQTGEDGGLYYKAIEKGPIDPLRLTAPVKLVKLQNCKMDKWYTIKVVLNIKKGSYDIFINGKKKVGGIKFHTKIKQIDTYKLYAQGMMGTIAVDDLKVKTVE